MRFSVVTVVVVLVSFRLHAQSSVSGTVIDKLSKKPIQYATNLSSG